MVTLIYPYSRDISASLHVNANKRKCKQSYFEVFHFYEEFVGDVKSPSVARFNLYSKPVSLLKYIHSLFLRGRSKELDIVSPLRKRGAGGDWLFSLKEFNRHGHSTLRLKKHAALLAAIRGHSRSFAFSCCFYNHA